MALEEGEFMEIRIKILEEHVKEPELLVSKIRKAVQKLLSKDGGLTFMSINMNPHKK